MNSDQNHSTHRVQIEELFMSFGELNTNGEVDALVTQCGELFCKIRFYEKAPVVLPRAEFSPTVLVALCISIATGPKRRSARCEEILPGVSLYLSAMVEGEHPQMPSLPETVYASLRTMPTFEGWVTQSQTRSLQFDARFGPLVMSLTFTRDHPQTLPEADCHVYVHDGDDARIGHAYDAVQQGWHEPRYANLPAPIQMRASGGLMAWTHVLRDLPYLQEAYRALANAGTCFSDATDAFLGGVHACLDVRANGIEGRLRQMAAWLMFWLRDGALYEPTAALGTLLGHTDWSVDIPMRYIRLPYPSICILPPKEQRHLCGGAHAIQLLAHRPPNDWPNAHRAINVVLHRKFVDQGRPKVGLTNMFFAVSDEDAPLSEVIRQGLDHHLRETNFAPQAEEQFWKLEEEMRPVLEYAIKVLLYLNHDGVQLAPRRDYTDAPRQFPGLGKRKRDLKLAEVEQLYDRYIVGPECLPDLAPTGPGNHAEGRDVSVHWRRGHFKAQPHGPRWSLRKVVFIPPVLVRADKLNPSA